MKLSLRIKIKRYPLRLIVPGYQFFVSVFFGEKWYRLNSWKRYKLFGKLEYSHGFSIGPILFWGEGW